MEHHTDPSWEAFLEQLAKEDGLPEIPGISPEMNDVSHHRPRGGNQENVNINLDINMDLIPTTDSWLTTMERGVIDDARQLGFAKGGPSIFDSSCCLHVTWRGSISVYSIELLAAAACLLKGPRKGADVTTTTVRFCLDKSARLYHFTSPAVYAHAMKGVSLLAINMDINPEMLTVRTASGITNYPIEVICDIGMSGWTIQIEASAIKPPGGGAWFGLPVLQKWMDVWESESPRIHTIHLLDVYTIELMSIQLAVSSV